MSPKARQILGAGATGGSRRGVVIFAVLIVVVLSALIGWGMLTRADAQVASLSSSMKRAQARAAAWSGIQAVMARLAAQREVVVGGGVPEVDDEVEVFAEDGVRGVARVIGKIEPEAARLNVNTASVEMLVASHAVDQAGAGSIVAAARSAPFGSTEEVKELTRAQSPDGVGVSWTAVSADANVQAGVPAPNLGAARVDQIGRSRIFVSQAWTEGLGEELTERLGPTLAGVFKGAMTSGRSMGDAASVVAVLRGSEVKPSEWGAVLDAVTTTREEYLPGRIDLSRASARVLACVPGIGVDAAELVVRTRGRLDANALRSVAWPVAEGVLSPAQFESAVGSLAVRSLQWRVRIEAGLERIGGRGAASEQLSAGFPEGGRRGVVDPGERRQAASNVRRAADAEIALEGRQVFEFVVDVSSERPRLALLRDVTLEGPLRAWTEARARNQGGVEKAGEGRAELRGENGEVDDTDIVPPGSDPRGDAGAASDGTAEIAKGDSRARQPAPKAIRKGIQTARRIGE